MRVNTLELTGEMMRYAVVGGIAFLADWATLVAVRELLVKDVACGVYLATAAGFFVGLSVNYVLSLAFVFTSAHERGKGRSIGAFLIFGIVGMLGLLWTEIGMWIGVHVLAWDYRFVKALVAAIVLLWNYLGRKVLVFGGLMK